MRILITGGGGMLAGALFRQLILPNDKDETHTIEILSREALDITDREKVLERVKSSNPDVIINAAAYTAVDKAEEDSERELLNRVNGEGPKNLAEAAKALGAKFVHFSTDYVFAGDNPDGYDESFDEYDPVNAYGRSKLLGERAIKDIGGDYYIVRTSWLYGPGGNNFVDTMVRLMGERESLNVVNDQHGKPTYTIDLACAVRELIEGDFEPGVYHVSNETDAGGITWFKFAREIARLVGFDPIKVYGVPSTEYVTSAERPRYSVLLNTKIPPRRDWREALEEYIEQKKRNSA